MIFTRQRLVQQHCPTYETIQLQAYLCISASPATWDQWSVEKLGKIDARLSEKHIVLQAFQPYIKSDMSEYH
jgi:hypothetical protein